MVHFGRTRREEKFTAHSRSKSSIDPAVQSYTITSPPVQSATSIAPSASQPPAGTSHNVEQSSSRGFHTPNLVPGQDYFAGNISVFRTNHTLVERNGGEKVVGDGGPGLFQSFMRNPRSVVEKPLNYSR
jgi:hypothetical protein